MSTGEGKKFVDAHTYDITAETENTFGPTTLNNAMQKALGDKKANFSLAIMHSVVATNLENLKLLDYMKYTDADGIERDLGLATLTAGSYLLTIRCRLWKLQNLLRVRGMGIQNIPPMFLATEQSSTQTAV